MSIAGRPSREVFERLCKRRMGTANPERMRVDLWEWMVRTGADPCHVRQDLGMAFHYDHDPDWCFARFGMTRTPMDDGRIICIAGEHEDFYDPDFCIYNDVIVLTPAAGQNSVTPESGEVEIYGYPAAVFPPTDFHSATPVEGRIVLIGRLGYTDQRNPAQTPVYALDTTAWQIEALAATGRCPGWIYKHHAAYNPALHAITVRGGNIHVPGSQHETVNFAAHRLHLPDMRWELLSEGEVHRRFLIRPADGRRDLWIDQRDDLFRPRSVPHEWLSTEDRGVPVHRLSVSEVRVSLEDWGNEVRVLVEGDLPPEVTHQLLADFIENLGRVADAAWVCEEVPR